MSLILIVLIVLLVVSGGYFYAPRTGYTTPAYAPAPIGIILLLIVLYLLFGRSISL